MNIKCFAMCICTALGIHAQAEIIFSGENQDITINKDNPSAFIDISGSDFKWDDLTFELKTVDTSSSLKTQASIQPAGDNRIQVAGARKQVDNLEHESVINDSINYINRRQNFFSYTDNLEFSEPVCSGNFMNESGYLGLRIYDGEETYFGWIRVSTANIDSENASLTIHSWAWNSAPGGVIRAGQTTIPEPNAMTLVTATAGLLLFVRRTFRI